MAGGGGWQKRFSETALAKDSEPFLRSGEEREQAFADHKTLRRRQKTQ